MYATERHQQIAALIAQHGRVSVVRLADDFGVAQETIRRDLDLLQAEGLVLRVHGGAVAPTRSSGTESSLLVREGSQSDAKDRIALAAVALIPTGFIGAVYIDAGTTTARVASALATREASNSQLVVITNAVPIAAALNATSTLNVRMIGGRVRGLTAAAVGAPALAQLATLRPDIAIIGTNAVHETFGLSTPDEEEAEVKRAAVLAARRVIVVADSTKLGVESLVRFAGLDEIDDLVTDEDPTSELEVALRDADVDVVLS